MSLGGMRGVRRMTLSTLSMILVGLACCLVFLGATGMLSLITHERGRTPERSRAIQKAVEDLTTKVQRLNWHPLVRPVE